MTSTSYLQGLIDTSGASSPSPRGLLSLFGEVAKDFSFVGSDLPDVAGVVPVSSPSRPEPDETGPRTLGGGVSD